MEVEGNIGLKIEGKCPLKSLKKPKIKAENALRSKNGPRNTLRKKEGKNCPKIKQNGPKMGHKI